MTRRDFLSSSLLAGIAAGRGMKLAIHGVIFHRTPLVDMNLDEVNVSRTWIRANAARAWGA